jgi:hypothetical protein
MTYFIFVFFALLILPPCTKRQHPPIYAWPQPRSLSIIPCIVFANYWLIVTFLTKERPPKANTPPIFLFFDVSCFVTPSKGTNHCNLKPSAGCLQQTYREQRRDDLGAPLPYQWKESKATG